MPYSVTLYERIRDYLPGAPHRRMFGGVCFFERGHIMVGVFGDGMLVRVAPDRHLALIATPGIQALASRPGRMRGFVVIGEELLDDDAQMLDWIAQARAYNQQLP